MVIAVALVIRLCYTALGIADYWGDAYHSWMMSRLTLANHWVLTDYKGREVVWEPLFRYLATAMMALTGRADMLPGRLVSLVAGSLACGATAALGIRVTGSVWWGRLAGFTLAATPWHVAYSWMYMPEATAGLLFVLLLLELVAGRRAWTLPLLAAAGALARHDVTVLLLLTTVWLLATRRVRPALLVLAGPGAALAGWSLWTWHVTGDPLWWLLQRRAGSTADAAFWTSRGVRPAIGPLTLPWTLVQVYAPVLVLLGAVLAGARSRAWRDAVRGRGGDLCAYLFVAFLPVIGLMQLRFFSYPDPRYLLAIVPVACVLSAQAIGSLPGPGPRTALSRAHVALVVVSLLVQAPTFRLRGYTIERERAAGAFLRTAGPAQGPLWVDAPVAIYHSGLDPARFVSSDQVAPGRVPLPAALDSAYAALAARHIGMIYWNLVPYSRVPLLWPEMAGGEPFEARGFRFEPVFRYDGFVAPPRDRSVVDRWRQGIESHYGPAVLWAVRRAVPRP